MRNSERKTNQKQTKRGHLKWINIIHVSLDNMCEGIPGFIFLGFIFSTGIIYSLRIC
jgi:hypothetical protein